MFPGRSLYRDQSSTTHALPLLRSLRLKSRSWFVLCWLLLFSIRSQLLGGFCGRRWDQRCEVSMAREAGRKKTQSTQGSYASCFPTTDDYFRWWCHLGSDILMFVLFRCSPSFSEASSGYSEADGCVSAGSVPVPQALRAC